MRNEVVIKSLPQAFKVIKEMITARVLLNKRWIGGSEIQDSGQRKTIIPKT